MSSSLPIFDIIFRWVPKDKVNQIDQPPKVWVSWDCYNLPSLILPAQFVDRLGETFAFEPLYDFQIRLIGS
jgi:hypothetical protein